MRRLVALVLAAVLVTACGNGGHKAASTVPPQPTLPAGDTLPPSEETTPEAAPPATTDVAPPDAIGRLAASFTAQLISRQKKDVGLGPLACRDLAGIGGLHPAAVGRRRVLQPVQGGHDQGSPGRVPRHLHRRRERVALRRRPPVLRRRRQGRSGAVPGHVPGARRRVGEAPRGDAVAGDGVGDRPGRAAGYHRELNRSRSAIASGNIGASSSPSPGLRQREPRSHGGLEVGHDGRVGQQRRDPGRGRAERHDPGAAHLAAGPRPAPAPPPPPGARRRRGRPPAARRARREPSSRGQPRDAERRLGRRRRHAVVDHADAGAGRPGRGSGAAARDRRCRRRPSRARRRPRRPDRPRSARCGPGRERHAGAEQREVVGALERDDAPLRRDVGGHGAVQLGVVGPQAGDDGDLGRGRHPRQVGARQLGDQDRGRLEQRRPLVEVGVGPRVGRRAPCGPSRTAGRRRRASPPAVARRSSCRPCP